MTKRRDRTVEDPGKLATAWRAILATIGVLMTATGAYAVFKTKVESGPTALITIGALLTLIAAGGRAVTHFKVGDNEVDMAKREEAREEIRESFASEPDEVALARVETASIYDPQLMSAPDIRRLSIEAYRETVQRRIRALMPDVDIEPNGDATFTLIKGERRLPVYLSFPEAPLRLHLIPRARALAGVDADRLLIITAEGGKKHMRVTASMVGRETGLLVRIAVWRGMDDDLDLHGQIDYGLSAPERTGEP